MATHGLLSAEAPILIEESAIDEVNVSCEDLTVKENLLQLGNDVQ